MPRVGRSRSCRCECVPERQPKGWRGWHDQAVTDDRAARLHRFWLQFSIAPGDLDRYSSWAGLSLGCGVTAFTFEDAVAVLRQTIFGDDPLPDVVQVIEDIDVGTLDQGRVVPNMGPSNERGVWFPRI
jgi:hypothetical protein